MSKLFFSKVHTVVSGIPCGKVATYKQVAVLAGNSNAARAVGMAMKKNPDMKVIPCHRVVASDGGLCGYSAGEGIKTKKELLKKEGVIFINRKVDLSLSQWHPKEEFIKNF